MLVQMLQTLNRKRSNCTLVVTSPKDDIDGYLYIQDGTVIAASLGDKEGFDAATTMVSWEEPAITVYSLPNRVISNIRSDSEYSLLQELLLQADTSHLPDGSSSQTAYQKTTSHEHERVNDQTFMSHSGPLALVESITEQKDTSMPTLDETLKLLMEIEGTVSVAIVDSTSGMSLGSISNGLSMDLAAAGNSNVVRAKNKVMKDLGLKDSIEDILITLGSQYHLIRLVQSNPNLFIYLVLTRSQANLGMARYRLTQIEKDMIV